MKTYKVYAPGTKVYAISEIIEDGKKHTYHFSVFPAIVESITIDEDGISYWLKTPKGNSWGDSVSSDIVNTSFEILTNKLKVIWKKHAEWD